ncbi:hypothetical protein F5Y09DRAFT_318597 [Xylaria sp. FL1042]|nr:hypothetical protein F5Y09DRAFT_318597 [Xylaria sp. FL1042]
MAAVTVSSRRFACDRCRDQKLRCLKEKSDPSRCDRCVKANTECLTTPMPTVRTQSANHSRSAGRKRKYSTAQRALTPTYTDNTGSPMNNLVLEDLGDWPQVWEHDMEVGDSFDEIFMSSPDRQPVNLCTTTITTAATAPQIPALPKPTSAFDVTPGAQESLNQQNSGKCSNATVSFSLDGVLGGPVSHNSSSRGHPLESCVHRLSSTNLSLISQLGRIDHGPPKVTLDILISKSDESDPVSTSPVEDLLRSTRGLIEILEELSSLEQTSNCNSSELSLDPSLTDLNDDRIIDTSTLLLVLSCYVQVLRLYVVLFAHIHQFVLGVAESDDPTLCPLPNMEFGNFAVESGNLQATLFIQIAERLFKKLECLLGLPAELTISMRDADRVGLLCIDEDFQEIIKRVLFKEVVGKPEKGKGGVASLRKHMQGAVQLLHESIVL